ncbi:AAA family ATPase [Xenorhabdus cabanillasii]|uniref:AAA family ATPase n=1 Tax=Xenorhabdus cabanillasii TaxID=351673 RepID=UPI001FD51772|nr:AAA family ATPase [Xenorhabdus cabanillasii]
MVFCDNLKEALTDTPVVCLLGPCQVGKTTLVKELEPGRAYITFDDSTLLNAAKTDPLGFVQGLPDRVTLDEVQRVGTNMNCISLTIGIKTKLRF